MKPIYYICSRCAREFGDWTEDEVPRDLTWDDRLPSYFPGAVRAGGHTFCPDCAKAFCERNPFKSRHAFT